MFYILPQQYDVSCCYDDYLNLLTLFVCFRRFHSRRVAATNVSIFLHDMFVFVLHRSRRGCCNQIRKQCLFCRSGTPVPCRRWASSQGLMFFVLLYFEEVQAGC